MTHHVFLFSLPAIGLALAMVPDVPVIVAGPGFALGLVVFGMVFGEE